MMTNYAELVKALRCNQTKEECAKCRYSTGFTCKQIKLDMDAAEAIERLQYQLEKYHERVVYLEEKCKELPEWKVTIH